MRAVPDSTLRLTPGSCAQRVIASMLNVSSVLFMVFKKLVFKMIYLNKCKSI